MSNAAKSHYDSTSQKLRGPLLVVLVMALVDPSAGHAVEKGRLKACFATFLGKINSFRGQGEAHTKGIPSLAKISLTPEEKQLWREALAHEEVRTFIALPNMPPEYFFYLYAKLPEGMRFKLETQLARVHDPRKALLKLRDELSAEPSLLGVIADFAERHTRPDRFAEWFQLSKKHFADLPEERIIAIEKETVRRRLVEAAAEYWRDWDRFYVDLPFERTGANKVRVQVGTQQFEGIVQGAEVILWVKARNIGIPAWNALNTEKLSRLLRNGVRQPIRQYRVNLGLDGKFYLQDGNHRYVASGKSEDDLVQVRMKFPPRTVSLSAYLNDVGSLSPSSEDLLGVYTRTKNPFDAIPPSIRRRIIFNSEDLIQ